MKVKRLINRLYKIILEGSETKCLLGKSDESAWLWHSRLGHVNFKAISLMNQKKESRFSGRIGEENFAQRNS